jgi:hypothetical protein
MDKCLSFPRLQLVLVEANQERKCEEITHLSLWVATRCSAGRSLMAESRVEDVACPSTEFAAAPSPAIPSCPPPALPPVDPSAPTSCAYGPSAAASSPVTPPAARPEVPWRGGSKGLDLEVAQRDCELEVPAGAEVPSMPASPCWPPWLLVRAASRKKKGTLQKKGAACSGCLVRCPYLSPCLDKLFV